MVPQKKSKISLIRQEAALKTKFPTGKVTRAGEKSIRWEGEIKPSPLSNTYKIQLKYSSGEGIQVFIKDPFPLPLALGNTKLPHTYSTEKQKLCLYYPRSREWTTSMLYTETILPWISEWLIHYEIWLVTGEWVGGGIHPKAKKEEEKGLK